MKIERFEDILAWQKSKDLTVLLYKKFRGSKDFSFRDQILRASVSIMNNVAEGFERRGNKEFVQFLYIAKGSAGEVRSMILVAEEIGYVSSEEYSEIHSTVIEISRIISDLIKSIK